MVAKTWSFLLKELSDYSSEITEKQFICWEMKIISSGYLFEKILGNYGKTVEYWNNKLFYKSINDPKFFIGEQPRISCFYLCKCPMKLILLYTFIWLEGLRK